MRDRLKMIWKYQNVACIFRRRNNSEILPMAYWKGWYKSESSLMTCEAELHGWVSRMAHPLIGGCPSYEEIMRKFLHRFWDKTLPWTKKFRFQHIYNNNSLQVFVPLIKHLHFWCTTLYASESNYIQVECAHQKRYGQIDKRNPFAPLNRIWVYLWILFYSIL